MKTNKTTILVLRIIETRDDTHRIELLLKKYTSFLINYNFILYLYDYTYKHICNLHFNILKLYIIAQHLIIYVYYQL